jgi:hypothetical protein
MRQSPRHRRLSSDEKSLQQLQATSTILDYTVPGRTFGGPPEVYLVNFRGRGLSRPEGSLDTLIREHHQVLIRLGAAYPRQMPELFWKTPIFHPNISSNGIVCLGGYSTHWVPSLRLDQLCEMLWDMIRYENYDVESPYNREAAQWARTQTAYAFPIDPRPLRMQVPPPVAIAGRSETVAAARDAPRRRFPTEGHVRAVPDDFDSDGLEILFMDDTLEIVDAELVLEAAGFAESPEILFIE